jgi:hypothetical protein
MKNLKELCVGVCMTLCGLTAVFAQEAQQVMQPPKVLVVHREFMKPGKTGDVHIKSESAFIQAMAAAKWPTHYFAVTSLSGPSRALFLVGYDSFEAWEKDNMATMQNASLSAALDSALLADGELLSGYDENAAVYREDLSFHAAVNIAQMRYFEISRYVVRPGHRREWEALVKEYMNGYGKAVPDAHWAIFESIYGLDNGGVYFVFVPMKSLSEVDHGFADSKRFEAAMGESGMKRIEDLTASCIESSQTNLFAFSPKMSYPSETWVKADPDFWSTK